MHIETFKADIKTKTVNDMCYTVRHDFGLDKLDDDHITSGMTDAERKNLVSNMEQLYDHHISKFVDLAVLAAYPEEGISYLERFNKLLK